MPIERRAALQRAALVVYLAAVVVLTSIHDAYVLAASLGVVLLVSGRRAIALTRRVLLAAGPFLAVVSGSYAAMTLASGDFSADYLVLLNLRVTTLTALTFLVMQQINLARALGFSRGLLFATTLAISQVLTLRRVVENYRLALTSRTLVRLGLRDRYRHSAASAARLLGTALHQSGEIALAMRARGFFDEDPAG